MNIALYGGTFDPVHNGHIHVACEVSRLLAVERIVFIPSFLPPHKEPAGISAAHDRYEMLKQALVNLPFCTISTIEADSECICYTIDTVRKLKQNHLEWEQVYFIIGSDSIPDIYTWKEVDSLCREVTIAVAKRTERVQETGDSRFIYLDNTVCEIASRDIRAHIQTNKPFEHLVPSVVATYIRTHGLYYE